MNQILDYSPNKKSGGNSSGTDNIVRFFAIVLILFALCLLAAGAYGIYKNRITSNQPVVAVSQAEISVKKGETTATIRVVHEKAIEKLIYRWDAGKEMTIKGNGESVMEASIDLLIGKHTLVIKAVDIDGVETVYEEEITSENGNDKIFPVIEELKVTEDKKLRITATDETAIDFVTYRWNDGEEVRIDASEDDDKKITFEIDILKGQNDLLIIAVDKSSNSVTEQKSFTGITKPDVKLVIAADKKSIDIQCSHENGIKEIQLKINETDYQVDLPEENPKDVTLSNIALEGDSTVIVKVISVDGTETSKTEEIKQDEELVNEESGIEISIEKNEDKEGMAIAIIKSEVEIKEIKLNINDQDYIVNIEAGVNKEITMDELPLVEGNNKITIKVITTDDKEKEEIKEISL